MTPEYLEARRKLLWVIAWYGGLALGPLVVSLIVAMMIIGPTTPFPRYMKIMMFPVFVWGLIWVNLMLNYVRSHPLPTDKNTSSSNISNSK